MQRSIVSLIAFSIILSACQHRPEIRPSTASPGPLTMQILQGFVLKDGLCHFVHLDAATGRTAQSWTVHSKGCPDRVHRTIAADGSQLFAVRFGPSGGTALWQLQKGAQSLDVLLKAHNLELAWKEGGKVHGMTANTAADPDRHELEAKEPKTDQELPTKRLEELTAEENDAVGSDVEELTAEEVEELTAEELEAMEEGQWEVTAEEPENMEEDQWRASCYVNVLEDGLWKVLREQEIETHEGMRPPICEELFPKWDSNVRDYAGLDFRVDKQKEAYKNLAAEEIWVEHPPLNVTKSGAPCQSPCKNEELLHRFAFSAEWYEGYVLTGRVASWDRGGWKLLEGLDGALAEFFVLSEQIIFCSEEGFGSWDAKTGKRIWWRASPTCPFQKAVEIKQTGLDLPN